MDVEHFHPEPHTSCLIRGTKCDGCGCMHVIRYKRLRTVKERYWCDCLHATIDPRDVECARK